MESNLFKRSGNALKEIAKLTWTGIRADDVFGRAAQLAYYFFLALFPFLICVIASLSVFGTADRGRVLLMGLFAHILPGPAFHLISTTVGEIIQQSGPLKMSFGIIASLWSASLGMSAVMDTLNAAYKVAETRSLFKQYAVALGLTLGIAVLLIISILAIVFGNETVGTLSSGNIAVVVWRIAQWPLGLALLLLAFAITYYFAPALKRKKWHWITPGAIAGVLLLIVVSIGLRIYYHFSDTYSAAYGSLGAVIVLLLCFYMSGVAVLSGGVLNAVLERLTSSENGTAPATDPRRALSHL